MQSTCLIFGAGYLGQRVAALWRDDSRKVHVVTRSAARAEALAAAGYRPHVADVTRPETLAPLPDTDTVLFAVGFDRGSGRSIGEVYAGGLASVLAALGDRPRRFLYISSTGVYGPGDGGWVDEETPCHPDREGGQACLAAEQTLAASSLGPRSIILRLAGIYGPGRIPRAADLLAGKPLAAHPDTHLNLIHVDDAARIVLLAEQAAAPRTYVVSDGHPVLRRDYFAELARLLSAPAPTFISPPADGPPQRGASDRKANNARLLRELKPEFAYPSYREGLAAIVAEQH
ncbi:MAG: NAD-dependent epimerase/dehydratase family protein [Pirellulales bacterium]